MANPGGGLRSVDHGVSNLETGRRESGGGTRNPDAGLHRLELYRYTYDGDNRVRLSLESNVYVDVNGNPSNGSIDTGVSAYFEYDAAGNRIREVDGTAAQIGIASGNSTWDTLILVGDASNQTQSTRNAFDGNHRLTTVNQVSNGGSNGSQLSNRTHDAYDRVRTYASGTSPIATRQALSAHRARLSEHRGIKAEQRVIQPLQQRSLRFGLRQFVQEERAAGCQLAAIERRVFTRRIWQSRLRQIRLRQPQPGHDGMAEQFQIDMAVGQREFELAAGVGSSRVDLQACKLEYSIVSPK